MYVCGKFQALVYDILRSSDARSVRVSGGGGPEGYVFCCNNIYCGIFNPKCLLIIINLNAFDVALAYLLHAFFK